MFKLIGVPLDGTPHAEDAVFLAARLARLAHARLELILAHQPAAAMVGAAGIPSPALQLDSLQSEQETEYLSRLGGRLAQPSGAPVRAVHPIGSPGRAICEAIEQSGVDLIIMTSHGRAGMRRMWLGSVAEYVVRHGGAPVLLLGPCSSRTALTGSRNRGLLLAVDFSPESQVVIEPAAALARLLRLHVTLLHVIVPGAGEGSGSEGEEDPVLLEVRKADSARRLDELAHELRHRGCSVSALVRIGTDPASSILDLLDDGNHDAVAMGTRGAGQVERLFVGSVATRVMRSAPVPVLVMRQA